MIQFQAIFDKLLFSLMGPTMSTRLVLASSSRHRRQVLERLGVPFETLNPDLDESPRVGEAPRELVVRLSREKAAAARQRHADGLAIGSDQVALCAGEVLGKPGDHARAVAQLERLSGNTVEFLTGICVHDLASGRDAHDLAVTSVRFRTLTRDEIERYLAREPAYDSAGSFKSEGLGITLVESIDDDDPTALIGLPLIRLCRLLRGFGYPLP